MGGAHYFVLRQGGGRIFVTSLHFTTKKRPCLHYHNLQQDIAQQHTRDFRYCTLCSYRSNLEKLVSLQDLGGPYQTFPMCENDAEVKLIIEYPQSDKIQVALNQVWRSPVEIPDSECQVQTLKRLSSIELQPQTNLRVEIGRTVFGPRKWPSKDAGPKSGEM